MTIFLPLGLWKRVLTNFLQPRVSHSILSRHPTFAAKCYRLVRQLCLHQFTSSALSRYLRNRERFFLRQCRALPFTVPAASKGGLGGIRYQDGREVVSSSAALCAILQAEAWLLESTSLELNVLATGHNAQRVLELVNVLFIDVGPAADDEMTFDLDGPKLPRMLEIFHDLDFSWLDAITPTDVRFNFFGELRFESCLQTDATGCEVYDLAAVLSLLGAARRELQNRGLINTPAQQEDAKKEKGALLERIVVENHRREIQFARFQALRAWRSLLDISLTRAFDLFPAEGRYSLLLDFILAILTPIAAPETDQAIGELLSGAAVLLVTKLRDEGVRIEAVDVAERLHSILRALVHAIVQPGVSAVVRGNLYAALLNYVQLSGKVSGASAPLARTLAADESSASMSVVDEGGSTVGGSIRAGRRNALEAGNLLILQSALERLLPTICKDAAVGDTVWRTLAFSALDTLVMVAEEGRATSKVLGILSKQGYLQNFVASLKDAELDLLDTLKAEPGEFLPSFASPVLELALSYFSPLESLDALYTYETQMSFLIRLASTREGAEKLLTAELFGKLAQCDYLGARPEDEPASMGQLFARLFLFPLPADIFLPSEFDGFLPNPSERHHQLLLPALQLVVGTLVSFGAEATTATTQVSSSSLYVDCSAALSDPLFLIGT